MSINMINIIIIIIIIISPADDKAIVHEIDFDVRQPDDLVVAIRHHCFDDAS